MAAADKIKEDGRAFTISNFKFDVQHRDPDYQLIYNATIDIGPTGEWTLFRFEHPDGHWYRGRWDEKVSRLDIDLFKTKEATKAYKKFTGHHPCKPDKNVQRFIVEVERADGVCILKGVVSFALLRKVSFNAKLSPFKATLGLIKVRRSLSDYARMMWSKVISLLSIR